MVENNDFYTEIYIDAPREQVWDAFVGHGSFFQAFYGAELRSSFEIGAPLEYSAMVEGNASVHIYGEVLAYAPQTLLAYTDHPGPMYAPNHADLVSHVRITWDTVGSATRLTLTNDQFSENNPMRKEATQWYLILSNFKTFVETGHLMILE
jgi:uncharacterized protein YndB with AHSA1/START domain